MKTPIILAVLVYAVASYGQSTSSSPKPNQVPKTGTAQKPVIRSVYSLPWESGEIKSCTTYSGQPYLLECDGTKMEWEGAFINLLADNQVLLGKEEAYQRTFSYVIAHSKQFLVSFSREPWPKPQTGHKMTSWNCTKEKVISCSFGARE
jgi:hypothetical protein